MTTQPCPTSGLDPAVTARIGELLRERGLRRMASRIHVLAVLEFVNEHLSVAEIRHHMLVRLPAGVHPPDLSTVYRTVTTLVDQGVLHALAIDSGVTTYGMSTAPHHHAVCTKCHRIIEVPAQQLSSALQHAMAGSSFALSEQAGLTLRGLCPNCQESVQDLLVGEGETDPRPPKQRGPRAPRR